MPEEVLGEDMAGAKTKVLALIIVIGATSLPQLLQQMGQGQLCNICMHIRQGHYCCSDGMYAHWLGLGFSLVGASKTLKVL